jgi:cell division protein FtsI/penicillin-binding protein 2
MKETKNKTTRSRTRFTYQQTDSVVPDLIPEMPDYKASPRQRRTTWYLSPYARVRIAAVLVTFIAAALLIKLFYWQVQQAPSLSTRAENLHTWTSSQPARRGVIYDANGLLLASNTYVFSVRGAPRGLNDKQTAEYTEKLSKFLPNIEKEKIRAALTINAEGTNNWNLIAVDIDSATAELIRKEDMEGIFLEPKARRVYPNGTLLAHLLGFTNYEMKGAYGVEGYYDKELSGKPGTILAERDAAGAPIALSSQQITAPVDGGDLTLTIDSAIQAELEREVLAAMFQWKATGASGIVMNPRTGAILGSVSYPDYDPNEFYKTPPERLLDPVVSGTYEPGSTFKIFTAGIGIETGAVTPDSAADLPGCVMKYGFRVCNYNSVGYDNQTVVKTLQKSSNVGAMWIIEKYGPEKYYSFLKDFGIGKPTGIDLAGEAQGFVRWQNSPGWSMLDLDMNAFGQAITVTPMQLITAVSAVANGGKLMQPHVVSKITRDGKIIQEFKPQVIRQVISPESAKTTTDMLVQAVKGGETRLADVKGYQIAGKTGTAQFVNKQGIYDPNLYIGSTIAYAPAQNPQFVVLVKLDQINTYGSNTAAPAVKNITEFLLNYYNIPPTEAVEPEKKP